jgi:hypothetical protein
VALVGGESCFVFRERYGEPSLNALPVVPFSETWRTMNETRSNEALVIENELRRINHNRHSPRLKNTHNE